MFHCERSYLSVTAGAFTTVLTPISNPVTVPPDGKQGLGTVVVPPDLSTTTGTLLHPHLFEGDPPLSSLPTRTHTSTKSLFHGFSETSPVTSEGRAGWVGGEGLFCQFVDGRSAGLESEPPYFWRTSLSLYKGNRRFFLECEDDSDTRLLPDSPANRRRRRRLPNAYLPFSLVGPLGLKNPKETTKR